jgi:hypothetical protein
VGDEIFGKSFSDDPNPYTDKAIDNMAAFLRGDWVYIDIRVTKLSCRGKRLGFTEFTDRIPSNLKLEDFETLIGEMTAGCQFQQHLSIYRAVCSGRDMPESRELLLAA